MNRKTIFLILNIIHLLFLFTCKSEDSHSEITFPTTPVLSITSSWGVVKANFLRIREEPSKNSKVVHHIRKSSIIEILSKTDKKEIIEELESYWYRINFDGLRGWIFGGYLDMFDSKEEAEKAVDVQ